KVVDFGIAKTADAVNETRAGTLKGKVAYMPPEQVRGDAVDRRADVFSVGVMLWEGLSRRRLWKGMLDADVVERSLLGPLADPRTVNAAVPRGVCELSMTALAPDPDHRFATAAEMAAVLERELERRPHGVSLRDGGRLVAEAFAKERAGLRAIVDAE